MHVHVCCVQLQLYCSRQLQVNYTANSTVSQCYPNTLNIIDNPKYLSNPQDHAQLHPQAYSQTEVQGRAVHSYIQLQASKLHGARWVKPFSFTCHFIGVYIFSIQATFIIFLIAIQSPNLEQVPLPHMLYVLTSSYNHAPN